MLLLSLLATSSLVGKNTIQVFGSYEKNSNLFFSVLAQSGTGKSTCCHLGCSDPIVKCLEFISSRVFCSTKLHRTGCSITCRVRKSPFFVWMRRTLSFISSPSHPNKPPQAQQSCKWTDFANVLMVMHGGVSFAHTSLLAFTTLKQFLEKFGL